jgi:hypothetical protein
MNRERARYIKREIKRERDREREKLVWFSLLPIARLSNRK